MKRKQIILLITLLLAVMLSGCGSNGMYRLIFVTEGEHTISTSTSGELVIMGGAVTINENAALDGSAHLVSGTLTLEGAIRGDVSALGGTLKLGDHAAIEGILNHGGGKLEGNAVENVAANVNTGTGIQIPELASPQRATTFLQLSRFILNAALLGLLALGLNRYLSRQLILVGETIVQHVWVSVAMGVLVGIVGLTLVVLMAYTILLIPVAMLGFFVLAFSIMFGWISFATYLGQKAAPDFASNKPKLFIFSSIFLTMLCMNLISLIPVVGSITNILFGVIGLGAVFLTRFGMRRFVPETIFNQY
jgi:hypothetical protein